MARWKPYLSPQNKRKRLWFAERYANWGVSEWNNVLFSDESAFQIGRPLSNGRVLRKAGIAYDPSNTQATFSSGHQTVMIWGGIYGYGTTPLYFQPPGQDDMK